MTFCIGPVGNRGTEWLSSVSRITESVVTGATAHSYLNPEHEREGAETTTRLAHQDTHRDRT